MFRFKKNTQEEKTEKRRSERLKPDDIFLVEFQRNSSKAMRLGQGRDISQDGIRFATAAALKKKENLKMTVYFPKSFPGIRRVTAHARVVRIYRPVGKARIRVGCRMACESEIGKEAIRQFIYWMEHKIVK